MAIKMNTCQKCGRKYKIDLLVPDYIWCMITPSKEVFGGLLCGSCIIEKLERICDYSIIAADKIVLKK